MEGAVPETLIKPVFVELIRDGVDGMDLREILNAMKVVWQACSFDSSRRPDDGSRDSRIGVRVEM